MVTSLLMLLFLSVSSAHPASKVASFCLLTNGNVCLITDGKIYVNDVLKGNATPENYEELEAYNKKMYEWTKALHNSMFETLREMIDDMFGKHGSFWRRLRGSFWDVVNAYTKSTKTTAVTETPKEPGKESTDVSEQTEQSKNPPMRFPELAPFPEVPSFCKT